MPKASVIIATYNWSSVLPYSIASALEQTERDLEVLVIGDACTDDSEEVVRSIGDPRVHWYNLPERFGHQSGPNNEGIRRAEGEFIFYLGHDDLWLPHHVESFLTLFKAGADLVHGISAVVFHKTEDDVLLTSRQPPFGVRNVVPPGMYIPPTTFAHRRSVFSKVEAWRDYRAISRVPDQDLVERIFDAGFNVDLCPRLTSIKIPSHRRRNVYITKPCEEQEAWLARIRSDPHLEAKLLGRMLAGTDTDLADLGIIDDTARLLKKILRRMRKRWRKPRKVPSAQEWIDSAKKLKGSDP